MSAEVSRGVKVEWAGGFGLGDISDKAPATARTVYQVGSITKTFTAALAERSAADAGTRKGRPELATDRTRNNDFRYFESGPKGLICPLGSHIRLVNPRDGLRDTIVSTNIHRVLRRGASYGPVLPDDVLDDDGAERGVVFIFIGASLTRQFEFVQQIWINNGDFVGLGVERDPLVGNNDGTGGFTIPSRPIRRHLTGLPGFVRVRGGEYSFLPGLNALKSLAN